MNNVEKSLSLSPLGWKCFPVDLTTKRPLTRHGHLDGTDDHELLATWFSLDFTGPNVGVGVWTGGSGLLVADLDRKNGRDAKAALESAWLDLPESFEYPTKSGAHRVYLDPNPAEGAPSVDYDGISGLDIRRGSSYIVYWSDEIPLPDQIKPAPEWLLRSNKKQSADAPYTGDVAEWLESVDAEEPDQRVLDAILSIPDGEFDHPILVEKCWQFVRLAAEGALGVRHGIDMLRGEWLRDPWDTEEYRVEFDLALSSAVRKAGALEERIASLPDYADSLSAVTDADGPNLSLDLFVGSPQDRAHYFKTIRALVPVASDDAVLATLVWNAPTMKTTAREFGIDYLFQKIAEERAQWDAASREQASMPDSRPSRPEVTNPYRERDISAGDRTPLLTEQERAIVASHPGFIDEYLTWVDSEFTHWNEKYHRACAWQVLSAAFGGTLFVAKEGDNLPLNIYTMNLGLTGTGKSDAMKTQRRLFRYLRPEEEGIWLFSGESSPQMLQEMLIDRHRKAALLSEDEAGGFYGELARPGGHMRKMETLLNRLFDGYVDPVAKRVSKEIAGKSAVVSFSLQFFGTPALTMEHLNERMIATGHLARMLWTVDLSESKGEEDFKFRLSGAKQSLDEYDPIPRAFAARLRAQRSAFHTSHPVDGSDEALDRLETAAQVIHARLQSEFENWETVRSPYRRFRDSLLKCAALHGLARGAKSFSVVDVLHVLVQAEIWLEGLLMATRMLAGSGFSREVDEIALFVKEKELVTEAQVYRKFQRWEYRREFLPRWEAAQARGLIKHRNIDGKTKWEWVE